MIGTVSISSLNQYKLIRIHLKCNREDLNPKIYSDEPNKTKKAVILQGCARLKLLEPVCYKKRQKKFMTSYWFGKEGISRGFEWYEIDHPEPSDVTYSPNQYLVLNFFCRFLQQTSFRDHFKCLNYVLTMGLAWQKSVPASLNCPYTCAL